MITEFKTWEDFQKYILKQKYGVLFYIGNKKELDFFIDATIIFLKSMIYINSSLNTLKERALSGRSFGYIRVNANEYTSLLFTDYTFYLTNQRYTMEQNADGQLELCELEILPLSLLNNLCMSDKYLFT